MYIKLQTHLSSGNTTWLLRLTYLSFRVRFMLITVFVCCERFEDCDRDFVQDAATA